MIWRASAPELHQCRRVLASNKGRRTPVGLKRSQLREVGLLVKPTVLRTLYEESSQISKIGLVRI